VHKDSSPKKSSFDFRALGKLIFDNYLSIIPIALMITIVYLTGVVDGFSVQTYVAFLISSFAIGFGLFLFSLGSESSIFTIGSFIGGHLVKHKKLILISLMTFILGVIITIAEPDLKILAAESKMDEVVIIAVVSVGVGLFFLVGVLRILFNKNLQVLFLAFYGLIFALAGIVNPKFLPLAFDSGAVVTGPLTIPFILSFGAGLAHSRTSSTSTSSEDSFGLTALVTAGPILAVLILSLFVDANTLIYKWELSELIGATDWASFWPLLGQLWGEALLAQLRDIAIAIVPLGIFFFIYDALFLRLPGKEKAKILVGLFYVYIGIAFFLAAVGVGFLPVAQKIGYGVGIRSSSLPLAVGLAALFGFFGVLAEPAVHVLVKQIETVSDGVISSKTVLFVMACSVALGMALQAIRAYFGFSFLYYFIPLYAIALSLQFFVPKMYANIAFDSGSIASGPMAASFVMPFIVGLSYAWSGSESIYVSAFGTIGMVSAMPLVVIQLLGAYAEIKRSVVYKRLRQAFVEDNDCQVIHLSEE